MNGSRGAGGMLPRENFKILRDVMAFSVLFEPILIKRFVPRSESFIKYDAFCSHIFDLRVLISGQESFQNILVEKCNFELG